MKEMNPGANVSKDLQMTNWGEKSRILTRYLTEDEGAEGEGSHPRVAHTQ